MAAIGFAIALCPSLASAGPPSGMEQPFHVVQAGIEKLTDCREWWQAFGDRTACSLWQTRDAVFLTRDKVDGTVETVEMVALAGRDDEEDPLAFDVTLSRETVIGVVRLLLPDWTQASVWMADALEQAATHFQAQSVIRIGRTAVVVISLPRQGTDDDYAIVAVTKSACCDEWNVGGGSPRGLMSIVDLQLEADEFVEGFVIDAADVDMSGFCHIPDGWSVYFESYAFEGQLNGETTGRAAGLGPKDLGELRGLFLLNDWRPDVAMNLDGEVTARSRGTGEVRTIRLQPDNYLFETVGHGCP